MDTGTEGRKTEGKGKGNVGRTKYRWTEKIKGLSVTYRNIPIEIEIDEYTSCQRD
jgi:hypothetical protein